MYDYKKAIANDVMEWIADDDGYRFCPDDYGIDDDDIETMVTDLCRMMTGYWRVTGEDDCPLGTEEESKEFLQGNEDLAADALPEEILREYLRTGQYCKIDTAIRRNLLPQVVAVVVTEKIVPWMKGERL